VDGPASTAPRMFQVIHLKQVDPLDHDTGFLFVRRRRRVLDSSEAEFDKSDPTQKRMTVPKGISCCDQRRAAASLLIRKPLGRSFCDTEQHAGCIDEIRCIRNWQCSTEWDAATTNVDGRRHRPHKPPCSAIITTRIIADKNNGQQAPPFLMRSNRRENLNLCGHYQRPRLVEMETQLCRSPEFPASRSASTNTCNR